MLKSLKGILFTITILIGATAAYAVESVGMVIETSGNAWVERNGTKTVIELRTPVFVTDVIATDATGKVQILFNDDTSLAIGASSVVSIDEFVFNSDATPSFAVSAVKGVSRVITGKIVEQNREGFKVSTPLATVGIRGTIVTIRIEDVISVILDQIGPGHNISVTGNNGEERTMNIAGYTIKVSPEGQVGFPEETTDEDIQVIGQALGLGTSDDEDDDDSDDDSDDTGTQTSSFLNNDNDFDNDDDDFDNDNDINDLDNRQNIATEREATYAGNLNVASSSSGYDTGVFAFTLNLADSKISDAKFMIGKGADLNYEYFKDGNGAYNSDGSFDLSGFNNVAESDITVDIFKGSIADNKVNLEFEIGNDDSILATGTGAGSKVPSTPTLETFAYEQDTNKIGFKLDIISGVVTDAYFVLEDSYDVNIATNGSGILTPTAHGGYHLFIDSFTYESAGAKDDYSENLTINGSVANGNFDGSFQNFGDFFASGASFDSSSSVEFDEPSINDYTKQASYKGTELNYGSYIATTGFNVDFLSNEITGAYVNVSDTGGSDMVKFENGSGTLSAGVGEWGANRERELSISSSSFTTNIVDSSITSATLDSYTGWIDRSPNISSNHGNVEAGVTINGNQMNSSTGLGIQ